jgi:O-antigen ligase
MSIRITVLTIVVLFLSVYAWRNWFNALLGGIVLFAFLENPQMPRAIGGIQGLNFWNLIFLNITFAWFSQRQNEEGAEKLPNGVKYALWLYLAVVTISFLRAFVDPTVFYLGTRAEMFLNNLFNPLKFLLPAMLLYDGCRTRERVYHALIAILAVYLFLAVLTIKSMGLHLDFSSGDELQSRASRRLPRDVGYGRVNLSMMLAGASWAFISFSRYYKELWIKLALFGAAGVIFLGQAMTGGRTGYVTWAAVGLFLCAIKWRKLLPLLPIAVAILLAFVPAVRDRMLEGFSHNDGGMVSQTENSEITSGRTNMWPLVIEEIKKSPLLGNGRIAMQRTGLTYQCIDELGERFDHPHNAYFEWLLDNGFIGFACAVPLFVCLYRRSYRLFRLRDDPLFEAVGGTALALMLTLWVAALGSQTFYPEEGVVPMWCALAVALRASVGGHLLENSADQRTWPDSDDASESEPRWASHEV